MDWMDWIVKLNRNDDIRAIAEYENDRMVKVYDGDELVAHMHYCEDDQEMLLNGWFKNEEARRKVSEVLTHD